MTWLDDLLAYLATNGFGTVGVNLIGGYLPAEPASIVAVIPYPGLQSQRTHDGHERRFPRCQVMCRSQDLGAAWATANQIRDLLRAFAQQTIGSLVYETIEPLGEPFTLSASTEAVVAPVISCNYEVRFHAA